MKEFKFKGKTLEELKKLDLKDFAKLLPSRQRRSIVRGLTDQQKILLKKLRKNKENKKPVRTQVRDMIVLPEMVSSAISIHNGRGYTQILVMEEMLGHYLGEFTLTRKKVVHSSPGIGATKSSAGVSKAK